MKTIIKDRKTEELIRSASIVFIGFLCATLFCVILSILAHYQGNQITYPYNTFLDMPDFRFSDFGFVYLPDQTGDPYSQHPMYFPFFFVIFKVFAIFPMAIALDLFCITFCIMLFFAIEHYTKDTKRYFKSETRYYLTISTFLLSYPVLFCLDRGNIEIMLLIFTMIFFILVQKKKYYLSAIILSMAISIKGLPIVFLVLLLKEKQYKAILLCLLSVIALTFISLMTFKSGIKETWISYHQYAPAFVSLWLLQPGAYHSTSLFLDVKVITWYLLPNAEQNSIGFSHYIHTILNIYNVMATIIFAAITAYVIKYESSFWKNIALLTFAMIILPGLSYDYKLLNILPVLFIFLNRTTYAPGIDKIYLILITLLLIPKNYYYLDLPGRASINNPINMICIFIITGLIIHERFKKKHS